jgi:hypothetical protein
MRIGLGLGIPSLASRLSEAAPDFRTDLVWELDMLAAGAHDHTSTPGFVTSITDVVSSTPWTEASVPPTYLATGLAGKPCLDLNGTTQQIISSHAAPLALLQPGIAHTYVCVFQPDVPDSNVALFGAGVGGGIIFRNTRWYGLFTTGAGVLRAGSIRGSDGTTATADSVGEVTAAPHVVVVVYSGTTATFYLDNGAADPVAAALSSTGVAPTRMALGDIPTLTIQNRFDGKQGCHRLYSAALTAPQVTAVIAFLRQRWGF